MAAQLLALLVSSVSWVRAASSEWEVVTSMTKDKNALVAKDPPKLPKQKPETDKFNLAFFAGGVSVPLALFCWWFTCPFTLLACI